MRRIPLFLAMMFAACGAPDGEDTDDTTSADDTVDTPTEDTVDEPTDTPDEPVDTTPAPWTDALELVAIDQPPGLFGAYEHIMDLAVTGTGFLTVTGFNPQVIDVRTPTAPTTVERLEVPTYDQRGRYHRVKFDDGDLFTIGQHTDLVRLTVAADGSFTEAARRAGETERVNNGIDAEGDLVFLAAALDGVLIYDRATLQTVVGALDTANAVDVAVSGTTAWVIDREEGLVAFDLTHPAAPVRQGSLAVAGGLNALTVEGGLAVIAASSRTHLVDVRDPLHPALYATLDNGYGTALRADLSGDLLITANEIDWRLFDVADPAHPRLIGVEDSYDSALSVAIDGDYAYVGDWDLLKVLHIDRTARSPEIDFAWPLNVFATAGAPAQSSILVNNRGTEPLRVFDAWCPQGVHLSPTTFELAPGASVAVTVDLDFVMPTMDTFTCFFSSNDADEAAAPLQIEVNRTGPTPGKPAPAFSLPDLNGEVHALSDYAGKVVFIDLFSSFCQQCVSSVAHVQADIITEFEGDPDFQAIFLSSSAIGPEDPALLAAWVAANGVTGEVLVDWNFPALIYPQWTITSTEGFAPYPRHFVVDQTGLIQYASFESDLTGAAATIRTLLGP